MTAPVVPDYSEPARCSPSRVQAACSDCSRFCARLPTIPEDRLHEVVDGSVVWIDAWCPLFKHRSEQ